MLPDEVDSFMYDSVLLLQADEEIRSQRVRQRNPDWTQAEILQVFSMQAKENALRGQTHDLVVKIINQGSISELEQDVLQQHLFYMEQWGNK